MADIMWSVQCCLIHFVLIIGGEGLGPDRKPPGAEQDYFFVGQGIRNWRLRYAGIYINAQKVPIEVSGKPLPGLRASCGTT